ncbi:MAG TPA: hypothetical protein VGF75_04535 [Candidatus Saccharimonadales bacterium]|jgi:hypothetical protein
MTTDLREQKLGQIDQSAAFERAGVEYIIDLIETREADLRAVFIGEGEEVAEEDVSLTLFTRITMTLDSLASEDIRSSGVLIRYMAVGGDASDDPAVKMGWMEYSPMLPVKEDYVAGSPFPHAQWLTEEGTMLIDGLRAAKGQVSLSEKRESNRAVWDSLITGAGETALD